MGSSRSELLGLIGSKDKIVVYCNYFDGGHFFKTQELGLAQDFKNACPIQQSEKFLLFQI